ncbi:hypothetical protein BA177_03770 [Woeseia oceani]|uniref:Uncharacterized protein n=2 Tax=Woeseia oceani TaxID=1548547 RepID=A0A193LD87_9GAMM|nr:hypothetical protein BA177_03770 [Woeseia oceani]
MIAFDRDPCEQLKSIKTSINKNQMSKNQTPGPLDGPSTPYIAYLRALSSGAVVPELDWAIVNKNYYLADSRIDRPAQEQAVRAALKAYDARPGEDTDKAVYDSLARQKWRASLFSEQRIHTLAEGLAVNASTISRLREIADETPHRIVFVNAVIWLLALSRDQDEEFRRIAGFDPDLTDAIWYVCEQSGATQVQANALHFSLAKAGSFEAQQWLCNQLDSDPSDEVRASILRFAYSDTSPESIELYGEPNPEFAPALINFVKKTKLLEELRAESIDDALCRAALTILAEGVCGSLTNGIELSHFKRTIAVDELLSLTIGHLKGRALSLDELFDLAWIYDCVFEEIDRWLSQDPDARFDEGDLVAGRREHRDLAKQIRSVYKSPENKERLEAAVKSGGIDGSNAKCTLDRIYGVQPGTPYEDFDERLNLLQDGLARGAAQRNVPLAGFEAMIEATNGDAGSVARAIAWCEDYLACMGGFGKNLNAGAQSVLQRALPLLRSRPGLGKELIRTGLISTTHCHMAMMVLRSYPMDYWPEDIERSLRSALTRSEIDAEMFRGTIESLVAYRAEKQR